MLIVLGIIGLIADMTIPTLVSDYRKTEVVAKLKKVYSSFNQALRMSEAENGDITDWIKDCGQSTAPACTTDELLVWFNGYIGKYLRTSKIEKTNTGIIIYLADGSIITMPNFIHDMGFYINKRALDKPKSGVNYFAFRLNPKLITGQNPELNKYSISKSFEPYVWSWNGTRDGLVNPSNRYSCSKSNDSHGSFCAKLIQYEGWQIPKDYPHKF